MSEKEKTIIIGPSFEKSLLIQMLSLKYNLPVAPVSLEMTPEEIEIGLIEIGKSGRETIAYLSDMRKEIQKQAIEPVEPNDDGQFEEVEQIHEMSREAEMGDNYRYEGGEY